MTDKAYQVLINVCEIPEIKKNARGCNEILGFISSIAAAPVQVEIEQWMPFLWAEDSAPSFSDEQTAVDFAAAVLQFYEQCLVCYQQLLPLPLPTEQWLDQELQVTAQGRLFAAGYLSAFHSIEAVWQSLDLQPGSEAEQLLQTSMLLLSKLAASDSDETQMQFLFSQLPDMPEIVDLLPALLSKLGHFSTQDIAYA
ncbi:UPF0149 family protein [Psychromonas aquimarina]|uniref:UPF0149 family protein n=1 Tax=Psychromonas aquimarina TaxID=444919 RepID=UPI0004152CA0|nr:UPF0149 family protein [Psychromonas aquimarina]